MENKKSSAISYTSTFLIIAILLSSISAKAQPFEVKVIELRNYLLGTDLKCMLFFHEIFELVS